MQKLSLDRLRVEPGTRVNLTRRATDDTAPFTSRKAADEELQRILPKLFELQERLWAADRWSVLLLLQGSDASGKDGTIEHVMRGLNPQGVTVTSFKQPSAEELDHDYLWRAHHAMPRRGQIGVFNRSHYEDVIVVRVHRISWRARGFHPSASRHGSGKSDSRTSTPWSVISGATERSSASAFCTCRRGSS
ncbi:MAG: hypothetical protein ACRD2X_20275 [Vicinamibacteraceae bacterium]